MKIALPREADLKENRVALIPKNVKDLISKGASLEFESGLGTRAGSSDPEYESAGAAACKNRETLISTSDLVVRVKKPPIIEVDWLKPGSIHISYLDPFNEVDLVKSLAAKSISALSMEMIPRTTRAQKMDVLSSQASLAGYAAVVLAAERSAKVFPMMMTPAGTIAPSRVFIIGAGVAGLQAIATAKRLGARVEAFDTRPVVKEQVQSLGARFVEIDMGETGETKGGYAKALTPEQLEKQRQGMAKVCAYSDIVITTAQVFGRKAPVIINRDMVSGMKAGSIIVDMAVDSGGNVEGSELDKEIETNGVRIIGYANFPSRVAVHASQMYSSNIYNLIAEFWDPESKIMKLNSDDEIIQGCLITHKGKIVNDRINELAG